MEQSDVDYDRAALSREAAIIGMMAQEFSADKTANAISQLVNLAETLGKLGQEHAEQVAKLRNSAKEALIVQQDCGAYKEALRAVGQMLLTSGPDLEATDFKQLLSVKRQLILEDLGYDPEKTREIQDFDRAVASARGDGADEGAACMTDDDLVMQTGADDVAANKACPITMTSVFDIEDPVEDEQRIVYDRQGVEKYIRGKQHALGSSVPCPLAGSSHRISLAGLRKATGVLRAQKRRQRQMATQAQNGDAADGVLDVD